MTTTSKSLITSNRSIVIQKKASTVFNFFANPTNDSLWRSEIIKSTMEGTSGLGALIWEYSYLSNKIPNNLLKLKCIEYKENEIAVFETIEKEEFYLKSERRINAISENETEVFYRITFDVSIVKF